MRIASLPFNEDLRLQDLYSYDILDSERDWEFDELLEVVADGYDCPIAAISFIDAERQWFKSKVGFAANLHQTSREISFCTHAISSNDVIIVEDATRDERFCNNPLVTGNTGIRFYAGAPIVSQGGYRLGSVCVIDVKPRSFTSGQAKLLEIVSRQVSKLLELRLKNKLLKQRAEEQLEIEKLLLQKTLQEHEAEKQSISTELHENIAQGLAATKFFLELVEDGGVISRELLSKSKENLAQLVKQVRELSQAITPPLLKEVELEDLLEGLLSAFYNRTNIKTKLVYTGREHIEAQVALTLYRMVEAQLSNVQQHAKASSVTVHINVCEAIYLAIRDDGIGIDFPQFKKGAGLGKIICAVEQFGGVAELSKTLAGGCELRITIPRINK